MNTADLYNAVKTPRAVALGAFDGVHLAHAAVFKKTVSVAKEHDCRSCAFTFYCDPSQYLGDPQPLISTFSQRERRIADLCIDETVYADFSKLKSASAEDFLRLITERLTPAAFVCGNDYSFGAQGRGDAALLKRYCTENGIELCIIGDVTADGERISSSRIRGLISSGDVRTANRLLGYSFTLTGDVVSGSRIGKKMGFPTANIIPQSGVILPKFGVYATYVTVDGERFRAVTNIGVRPTVNDGENTVTVESNLIGFCGDAYGKNVGVEFVGYIREETKFSSISDLAAQIAKDRDAVLRIFADINE